METLVGEDWKAREQDLDAIAAARNSDPFAVLGPHRTPAGWVIRVFAPEAISARALTRDGALLAELPRRKDDVFEALVPSAKERPAYRVEVTTAHGSYSYMDSYAFGPALGPLDDYLVRDGTHRQPHRRLVAQLIRREGVDGVLFALWAPNATRVSIVGDFNRWDGRRCQMRRRFDSGLWEIFVPELAVGAVYKFELLGPTGSLLPLKADPFGFEAELRPSTASVVADSADFAWTDAKYMAKRGEGDARRKSRTIYEAHLGSWRRGEGGRFLTYDELADQLIPYVADMGYTHLELLPISEHPLDESWGYQPIGPFSDRSTGVGAFRRHRALRTRRSAQGLPTGLEHGDLQFWSHRGRQLSLLQRPLLGRSLPHRRAARRRCRLDALPRLLPQRGRMAAERGRKQGKPRSDRFPPPRQRACLRRLSRGGHHRRRIDRLPWRFAADRSGRSWLWLQVEHGLDARHARLRVGRSDLSPLASQQDDLRPPLRLQRKLRAADLA